MKANRREPKSCFGRVFNFKLDRFGVVQNVHGMPACAYLKLKTWPRFCPVSLSLSMVQAIV
jgi:hypothetical protein